MGQHLKPEAGNVQGTCVQCGERPQASRGNGRFRATCSICHRGGGKHKPGARRRLQRLKDWLAEFKAASACARCGEDHPATLDFHHRDPAAKDFNLSNVSAYGWSLERIQAEIAKCEVLCANCHRKEHWQE